MRTSASRHVEVTAFDDAMANRIRSPQVRESQFALDFPPRSSMSATLSNELCQLLTTEILGPAKRRCVVLIVPDIGIGTGVKQQTRDLANAVLDRHVQRRVVAVPHRSLGVHGN